MFAFRLVATVVLVLASLVPVWADPRPALMVLPILPAQGQPQDGLGLGIQHVLEATLDHHDRLRFFSLQWRVGKLFAREEDFLGYAAGRGPELTPAEAAKRAEVRYVLGGRVQGQDCNNVAVWLFDAKTGQRVEAVLPLDAESGLVVLRKALFDLLVQVGLPITPQQRTKALWTEKTSLAGLRALGAATREQYVSAAHYRGQTVRIRLEPYTKAVEVAPDSSLAHNALGWGLYLNKEPELASKAFENALAIHPEGVSALYGMIVLAKKRGDVAALEMWLTHMALALGQDPIATVVGALSSRAQKLHEQASSSMKQARYQEAMALERQVLAIRERIAGAQHPDTATSVNRLGVLAMRLGEFDMAESLLKRALAIREKALGPEHADTLVSQGNLALLYKTMGEYTKAEPLYVQALTLSETKLGKQHPDTARCLNNLAALYARMGDNAKAEPLYKRSLTLCEAIYGPEHPNTAATSNNLALLYKEMGVYAKAEPLYQRALAIHEKAYGQKHPATATSLSNLGALYSDMEANARAEPLLTRALAIDQETLGPRHPDTAVEMGVLAGYAIKMDDYARAVPLLTESLDIFQEKFGPQHPYTAQGLDKLAVLEFLRGDWPKARVYCARALSCIAKGQSYGQIIDANSIMSRILAQSGNPGAAIFFGKQAVNASQAMRQGMRDMDRMLQKTFLGTKEYLYKYLADLLMGEGRYTEAEQVLRMLKEQEYFEYTRKDTQDSDPRATQAASNSLEKQWLDALTAFKSRLVTLVDESTALRELETRSQDEEKHLQDIDGSLRDAQERFVHLLDDLTAAFASLSPASREQIRTERFADDARRDLDGIPGTPVMLSYLILKDGLRILLTAPGVQKYYRQAIASADLNRLVGAWRLALLDPAADPLPKGRKLYDVLIAPVAEELKTVGATHLAFSLDGALRYIPMAALYDGEHYLAEKYELSLFTPASREGLKDASQREWSVAGFGVSKGGEFRPLPAVPRELHGIIKQHAEDREGVVAGDIYLDDAFTEKALMEGLRRGRPAVHVASHFLFTPGGKDTDSFLLLGEGRHLTLAEFRRGHVDLQGVDLLTLSACETGVIPQEADGREVDGLAIMAQKKGAKGVMATLWPVVDASTGAFMRIFYELHQKAHLSKAEALRQAQLRFIQGNSTSTAEKAPRGVAMLDDAGSTSSPASQTDGYRHPFYWAPFILMGNWR